MRIVSWNCGGASCDGFTVEKYIKMLRFNLDILLIQECTKKEFDLVSIWAQPPSDGSNDYQKTIFDALDYYNFDVPIILAGDFNTGSNIENIHRYEELKTKLEKYGLKIAL